MFQPETFIVISFCYNKNAKPIYFDSYGVTVMYHHCIMLY